MWVMDLCLVQRFIPLYSKVPLWSLGPWNMYNCPFFLFQPSEEGNQSQRVSVRVILKRSVHTVSSFLNPLPGKEPFTTSGTNIHSRPGSSPKKHQHTRVSKCSCASFWGKSGAVELMHLLHPTWTSKTLLSMHHNYHTVSQATAAKPATCFFFVQAQNLNSLVYKTKTFVLRA